MHRPSLYRRFLVRVLDSAVGLWAGARVRVIAAVTGAKASESAVATPVVAKPMGERAVNARRQVKTASTSIVRANQPRSLVGMSFAEMLELSRRSDEKEREQLLETLPADSPLKMALRYRIDAMPETPDQSDAAAAAGTRRLAPRRPPELPPVGVDLATAGVEELTKIPGIGAVRAQRIVDERGKHGPFRSLEDLTSRVDGIGSVVAEQIAVYLAPLPKSGAEVRS